MNYRLVFNQLGLLLAVLSAVMLALAAVFFAIEGWLDHSYDIVARNALFACGIGGLAVGGALWWFTRSAPTSLLRREALLLVSLTWLGGGVFSAMPYYIWGKGSQRAGADHPFSSLINCVFESISGLTTCGASILTDIEAIPRSLLLWRSATQWLGGIGIVVLFVAVLPSLGTAGRRLFRAETTGPTKGGVTPQVRDTARILWYIYLSLTVVQIGALRVAGMDWFDSVCHTFTTMSTGGFSTRNASIAAYSPLIQWIIIVFMVAGGVNFALYYQALRGRTMRVWKDPELRLFLALLAGGTIVLCLLLAGRPMHTLEGQPIEGFEGRVRAVAFTVISLQTTTGYATAEYDLWTPLALAILFGLVLVGGCAGSTSGGLKVVRLLIVTKILHRDVERSFRPAIIRPLRLGEAVIDEETKRMTLTFVVMYLALFAACSLALVALESHNGVSASGAMSAAAACVSNTGPGMQMFGAVENYGWLTNASKLICCAAMVIGRLELFTIIALLSPRFWRGAT